MNWFVHLFFANHWTVFPSALLLLVGLAEAGFRSGCNLYRKKDTARKSLIGGVQGAMLGMLGLLLGFTFAMSVARHDARRDLVLAEANAIGTTWLRAGMLPEAYRAPARDLLLDYTEARLKYQPLVDNPALFEEGVRQSADLHRQLWRIAENAAAEAPTAVTVAFINSLNETIDTDAMRLAAMRNTIPDIVWILLVVVAGFGCYISGYGSGAEGARSVFTSVAFPLLVAVVITFIFDIMNARQGLIAISQQPLIDLITSLSGSQPHHPH